MNHCQTVFARPVLAGLAQALDRIRPGNSRKALLGRDLGVSSGHGRNACKLVANCFPVRGIRNWVSTQGYTAVVAVTHHLETLYSKNTLGDSA